MAEKPVRSVLATDCGSTTTKAILIEKRGDEYRLVTRGEAPTTVEAPFEDVTRGVLNAIMEIEELRGRKLLDGEKIITPQTGEGDSAEGVDVYLSTSSAGGGLQMMVSGVVRQMTGESAERAALGAGAIVMDVIASNDGRAPHEKIARIRELRPDMILLSGGIDGGSKTHVAELAEIIAAAEPRPRLGSEYNLPIIYAGNNKAQDIVAERLGSKSALEITENIRPTLEVENLMPARHMIHDLFMEHVMAQAPGYSKLMGWTSLPIMPTPAAVGYIIERVAEQRGIEVVGVDIGGATTDVFSVFQKVFNRTVSANLGMSYSISNVLAETGLPNVMRWVPFDMDEADLRDRIKNKMIRPTTIPSSLNELKVEQAIAREALRLAFVQHKALAVGLKGVQQERTISDAFDQSSSGRTIINMQTLDLLVGSGGVLSHAPRRAQSAAMLIDAFMPEYVTKLAVDSIFMMPQLGVLASEYPTPATDVFEKDCLIHLGECIAPVGNGKKQGDPCVNVKYTRNGETIDRDVAYGDMALIPMEFGEEITATITPAKHFDMGDGNGKQVTGKLSGGVVGLIIDARGRPFTMTEEKTERVRCLKKWEAELGLYPA